MAHNKRINLFIVALLAKLIFSKFLIKKIIKNITIDNLKNIPHKNTSKIKFKKFYLLN